jgi:hypothetical protein
MVEISSFTGSGFCGLVRETILSFAWAKLTTTTPRLVPLASIITPSTLSIRSAAVVPPPTYQMNVPNIDFRSMNFVTLMQENMTNRCYTYGGPNPTVSRVTNAVMAQGEILPFRAPDVNASWELEFSGPSLKCDHVTGETFTAIKKNIRNSEWYGFNYYASWFPGQKGNQSNLVPFPPTQDGVPGFSKGSLVPSNNVDLEFYMASMPVIGRLGLNMTEKERNKTRTEVRNFTLIHCRLVNSTYKTSFSFTNGNPSISTQLTHMSNAPTLQSIRSSCSNTTSQLDELLSDFCQPSNRTCVHHPDFFETLSYQAVVDAFSDQISGRISGVVTLDANGDVIMKVSSNILNTALAETSDLIKLVPGQSRDSEIWILSLQYILNPKFRGSMNRGVGAIALDLPKAVEQLFQNVTVSLMTSAALR